MKFLVYANCQSVPIATMLGRLMPRALLQRCPAVHTIAATGRAALLEAMAAVDVIVHQPIEATQILSIADLKLAFPDKTFVSFPSIYFTGLFPQLCSLRHPTEGLIAGPLLSYHDARVVRAFLRGESLTDCLAGLSLAEADILAAFQPVLDEAVLREIGLDVICTDIIQENFRRRPLFHTFNHPTNFLLWIVAKAIAVRLGQDVSGAADLPVMASLDAVVAQVPGYLARHLALDWRQDQYQVGGRLVPDAEVVAQSYEVFARQSDFDDLCRRNKSRFHIPVRPARVV